MQTFGNYLGASSTRSTPTARSFEELVGPDPSEIDFEKLTQAQLEAIAAGVLPAELSPTGRAVRFSFETELPDLGKLSPEELSYVARTGYPPPGLSWDELR